MYTIFMNSVKSGTIETEDIKQYVESTYRDYKTLRYKINENEKEVYLFCDMLDVMKTAMNKQ